MNAYRLAKDFMHAEHLYNEYYRTQVSVRCEPISNGERPLGAGRDLERRGAVKFEKIELLTRPLAYNSMFVGFMQRLREIPPQHTPTSSNL